MNNPYKTDDNSDINQQAREKYSYLYRWEILDINTDALEDDCFLETEKSMMEHGIRTRVEKNLETKGFKISVPEKDYEVAKALYFREARAIIDVPKELYHVFEDDLSFKNKKLYINKYANLMPKRRYRPVIFMGIAVVVLLFMLKFVR